MSPTNHHVITHLRQLIYYNLDCNLLQNAAFLAGRLQAYEPRASEAVYLLALCYLRLGEIRSAYETSKSYGSRGTHLGCSYVFAQACLGLERYGEGVTALERSKVLWAARNNWNRHTETQRQALPDAAAVFCLEGKLAHAYEDINKAIDCYSEALKLNPFMWEAFIGLCDLGVNVRVPNIFKMTPEMLSCLAAGSNEDTSLAMAEASLITHVPTQQLSTNIILSSSDPFSVSTNRSNSSFVKPALFEKFNGSNNSFTPVSTEQVPIFEAVETPTGPDDHYKQELPPLWQKVLNPTKSAPISVGAPFITEPPQAPMRKARTAAGLGMDLSIDAPPRMKSTHFRSKSKTSAESEGEGNNPNVSSMLNMGITDRKRTVSGQVASVASSASAPQPIGTINDPMAPQRRSVRLFNQIRPQSGKFSASSGGSVGAKEGREIKKAKATGTKGRSTHISTVGRVVSGNRKHGDLMDVDGKESRYNAPVVSAPSTFKPVSIENTKEHEGLQWLLDLFSKLGSGYYALSHYRCHDAIQIFNNITANQRDTPWVLTRIARAMYEQTNYAEAHKYFMRIRAMVPTRLEDMHIYSSVLWQLGFEIDLAFLAHELLELDRLSPQAWCAVGNSFALQRDHDQALKCFKRATQLDPKFAYALTLQGHEYYSSEENDKAIAAYRSAITAEKRHYHAWYGLGRVYEKQGRLAAAEQHYRTASNINPTHAVLVCCIGTVLHKMKNYQGAYVQYCKSIDMQPKAYQARYKKAQVLYMDFNAPDKALEELVILKDLLPNDATVHNMLGNVYKALKDKAKALRHFTIAMNLDPKASQHIKAEMESLEDADSDVEESMAA